MTDIFWPELLPTGFLIEGLQMQPQTNVVRTAMDAGPKKQRRRYTARTVRFYGKQLFDRDEMDTFERFFHNVLADGVLRFNFLDPITNKLAEFRFVGDYKAVGMSEFFEVSLPLERLL